MVRQRNLGPPGTRVYLAPLEPWGFLGHWLTEVWVFVLGRVIRNGFGLFSVPVEVECDTAGGLETFACTPEVCEEDADEGTGTDVLGR